MIKNIRIHIKEGVDSNYNYIDILWYIIRWPIINTFLRPNSVYFYKLEPWQKGYWHIVTPITVVYHKFMRIPIIYHDCKKCGWTQFRDKHCKRCK